MRKVLLIDMDGVMVDFYNHFQKWFDENPELAPTYKNCPDQIPGIFRNPPPLENAIEAIHKLYDSDKYDMYIATAAPANNPYSASDKLFWLKTHFGDMFKKKVFITHNKHMLMGDYLIDDRTANGAGEFKGELLSFGWDIDKKKWNKYHSWDTILDYLL